MIEKNKPVKTQPIAIFGEVLIDQFPDGLQVLGGAPFNVAWHLQAFGLAPCLISRIGHDVVGESIWQAMTAWGMAVESVQIDPDYPTGTVDVTFNDGEPHYEILADQAYDFIAAQPLNLANDYRVLYHGTLALRNGVSKHALNVLKEHHTGKVFIDVNLRAPWWHKESVEQCLSKAHWVKLNHEELRQLAPKQNTLQETMHLFLANYSLDVLIVTCGSSGAMALNKTGEFVEVTPTENLTIVDTVGAGDAFSAVLLLGIQRDWSLSLTMERAQTFASALVTQRGATVKDLGFYQALIDEWNLD
ncbi:MAG: carbohydrate kinase [Methylococcaceae bacterium]|jgi:fructokinase